MEKELELKIFILQDYLDKEKMEERGVNAIERTFKNYK